MSHSNSIPSHPPLLLPPPLPPPPPPPPSPLPSKIQTLSCPQPSFSHHPVTDCLELVERELGHSIPIDNVCFLLPPKIVDGQIQVGPTCGMLALHLALAQTSLHHPITVNYGPSDILQVAKEKGFSTFGEMFSCKNLASLGRHFSSDLDLKVKKFTLLENEKVSTAIEKHFLDSPKNMIIIAYDKDVDFRPCQVNGRKAHWALILGMATIANTKEKLVFARHGKTRKLACWDLNSLLLSNTQLEEYDYVKLQDGMTKPIVPEGGLGKGLKGQLILISS